jgi:hypothetical protein
MKATVREPTHAFDKEDWDNYCNESGVSAYALMKRWEN